MCAIRMLTAVAVYLFAAKLGAQVVPPPTSHVPVSRAVEASIRVIPRPVLMPQSAVHLPEDRSGTFTPAELKGVTAQALAKGRIIGVADLSASNSLGLAPGKYEYVIRKSNKTWHLYALSGQHVVKIARAAQVSWVGTPFPVTSPHPEPTKVPGSNALSDSGWSFRWSW